jgi:hypothetical protein
MSITSTLTRSVSTTPKEPQTLLSHFGSSQLSLKSANKVRLLSILRRIFSLGSITVAMMPFVFTGGCATSAHSVKEGTPSLHLQKPYRYELTGILKPVVVLPAGEYFPIAQRGDTVFYKTSTLITINDKVQAETMGVFVEPATTKHAGWGLYWHRENGFAKGKCYSLPRPPFSSAPKALDKTSR